MPAMRFDILSADMVLEELGQDGKNMSLHIAPPQNRVNLRIIPWADLEKARWIFGH